MACSPATACLNEECRNRTTIVLFYSDSISTSSSYIIAVWTHLFQQINVRQKQFNMLTPTSPNHPKSPCSPRSPRSIVSQISPIEQCVPGWTPSTPVLRPAITHIQISTSHSELLSMKIELDSPFIVTRRQDTNTLALRASSPHNIFSPTASRFTCELGEEMLTSPIVERVLYVDQVNSHNTQHCFTPPPRRKRSLEATQRTSPALPPNAAQRIAEFDLCRPRHTRSKPISNLSTPHSRTLRSRQRSQPSNPPKLQTLTPRRPHPLLASITHLATPLIPLISVVTGLSHPEFPTSVLKYHLLTHTQLDSLARWYHQTTDAGPERAMYPAMIRKAWTSTYPSAEGDEEEDDVSLDVKRRRFGRFIGLRGCESPVVMSPVSLDGDLVMGNTSPVAIPRKRSQTETLEERMEREWRAAMVRAEEERIQAEKSWRGRF